MGLEVSASPPAGGRVLLRVAAVAAVLATALAASPATAGGLGSNRLSAPTGPRVLVTAVTGDVASAAAAVRAAGGRVLDLLSLAGGVSAQLPAGAVLPPTYRVLPDAPLHVASGPHSEADTPDAAAGPGHATGSAAAGQGITVAVVDTGVADVAGLAGRVDHVDVTGTGAGDGFGHGTFVAGLIAGNGAGSTDGRYAGVAPAARILDVRVADNEGNTSLITVLQGLQVVARHREVSVVNLSLSSGSLLPYQIDPLTAALDQLWRHGMTVVVPAGNDGPDRGTITSPGVDPLLLTVGALDGKEAASWSSRGPAPQRVAKPDLAAPGAHLISLRVAGSVIDVAHPSSRVSQSYFRGSGTSFSTALTSGSAAVLLAARGDLAPAQVKDLLTGTAASAPDKNATGAGALNLASALTAPINADAADLPSLTLPDQPDVWNALGQAIADQNSTAAVAAWRLLDPASRNWAKSTWSALSAPSRKALAAAWEASSWSGAFPSKVDGEKVDWASMNWASMNWASRNWASRNWAASSWSSENWASMNWASKNWASVNWASVNWASQNWASQNWASQNWASQNWASQNWASQNWASQNWR